MISFLLSFVINLLAAIVSFWIIRLIVIKNIKLPSIFGLFNMYGLMAISLWFFFFENVYYKRYFMIFNIALYILFYIRSYDSAREKFHKRFRTMLLSFGYTRDTYFETFLFKKLLSKAIESFCFGVATYYFLYQITDQFLYRRDLDLVIIVSGFSGVAAIVKYWKDRKLYKNLK